MYRNCPDIDAPADGTRAEAVFDTVLDRTVLGGYTSIGHRIRRRSWTPDGLPRMEGRVVLITGGTSGLGLAAAQGFARHGAAIWLAVRNRTRGEDARARILGDSPGAEVHVEVCDLSHLRSVRKFAETFAARSPRLDVLVNNAGVLTETRELSADGIELTFATNVLGPFLLTNLLVPLLQRSAPARVINVSSGGMYTQRIRVDDLQSERGPFHGPRVYARSKRAEVILTELWANRLLGTGVVVHAMHPGWVDTGGMENSLPGFYKLMRPLLRTPGEGADTIVWLGTATQPAASSGGFWHDRRWRPTHLLPGTRETESERERLWAQCAALSGWSEPVSESGPETERNGETA